MIKTEYGKPAYRPSVSGFAGVHSSSKKHIAYTTIAGKQVHLGRFDSVPEAVAARAAGDKVARLLQANTPF